jgi:outer membrane murein-binding lipoprotein Lpp
MRRIMLIALLLTGCQQADSVGREEYERLQTRVAQLESSVDGLAKKSVEQATPAKQQPSPPQQPEKKAANSYRLIGTSSQSDKSYLYPSKEKCEAAKASLLQGWKEEQDAMNPRPIVMFRPSPNCLPI